MIHELHLCKGRYYPPIIEIEYCFQIAYRAWGRIRVKLTHYQFSCDDEEIEFFKVLKPKFTAEIEYYSLLYHCLIFEPAEAGAVLRFWQKEYQRLTDFQAENNAFLQCYRVLD